MHRGAALLYAAAAVAVGALPATTAAFSGSSGTSATVASATLGPATGLSAAQVCGTPTSSAITLRGTRTALDSSNNTDLHLPVPTHVAGDLLVAHVSWRQSGHTVTVPAGWTLVRRDDVTGTGAALAAAVYIRVATASEPASYMWRTGIGERTAGGMTAWTGVDTAAPVAASGGTVGQDLADVTAPSVVAARASSLLLVLAAQRYDDTLQTPAGMTEHYDVTTVGGGLETRDVNVSGSSAIVAAGSTGTRVVPSTKQRRTDVVGQSVVLNPVLTAPPPQASLTWTPTSDVQATGYELRRSVGGTLQSTRTLVGRSTAATTEGPLAAGTTYTWQLRSVRGTWYSTAVSASLTTTSC